MSTNYSYLDEETQGGGEDDDHMDSPNHAILTTNSNHNDDIEHDNIKRSKSNSSINRTGINRSRSINQKMVQFQMDSPTSSKYRNDNVFDEDEDEYADLTSNMFLDEEQFFNSNYSTKRCLRRLLSYLRPQFWYYIFGFIALGITTLCQLLLPYYFALQIEQTVDRMILSDSFLEKYNISKVEIEKQYDLGIDNSNGFDWIQSSKYLLMIIAVQIPFTFVRYVLFTIAGFNFVTKLKADLFRSLLSQEVNYFDPSKSGELNAIVSSDTMILQNIVSVSFSTLFRCLFQSVFGLLILIFLSWRTTIFIISFVVLFLMGYAIYNGVIHPKYKYIQELYSRASSVVDNAITNITEIRLLNAESRELRSFETELETIYRSSKSSTFVIGFWIAMGAFSVLILLLSTFMFILYQTLRNDIKIFQYILYALMLTISVSGVLGVIGDFQKIVSSSRRIFSLIDRRPLVSFQGGVTPSNDAAIAFESVSFHHKNGSVLLSGVSFTIPKQKIVSLVGPSHSKDIIFSLIQGLYYPTRGSIVVGRIDTKALDLHYFRTKLYSITSNTVIFEGTVEQNIRYGLSHLSTQNIIEASKRANLHDFIIGLPHGYDTMLGKGERLSSLHIQKISIARAYLRDPSVLLIDESSCMLDQGDELLETLDDLIKNRTVLIIANRMSTLIKSHHIVVLDDSRLIEQGSHLDLVSKNNNNFYTSFVLNHFQNIPNTNNTNNNINEKNQKNQKSSNDNSRGTIFDSKTFNPKM